jgi:hypothetical protein
MKSEKLLISIPLIASICTIITTLYSYIINSSSNAFSVTVFLLIVTTGSLAYLLNFNVKKKKKLGFLWNIERGLNGGLTYNNKRHSLFRVKTIREIFAGIEITDLRNIAYRIGLDFSNDLINSSIKDYTQDGIKHKIKKWLKFDSMMGFGAISYEGDPHEVDVDWGIINLRFSFNEHDREKLSRVIAFYEGYFEGVIFGLTNVKVKVENDANFRENINDRFRYNVRNEHITQNNS